MAKLKKSFQRKEKKYALSEETYHKLREKLAPYMQEDDYGLHTIISLYFDTKNYKMIRHSMSKPMYKEKFRIRSYGVPKKDSTVFLEIKKKVQGVVYKRRMALTYSAAKEYINDSKPVECMDTKDQQVKEEIDWVLSQNELESKVMIAYDRRALFYNEDEDFRITFDFNIRYKKECLSENLTDEGARVAPEIDVLMEVKALGSYPIWFSGILSELNIYPTSFSKYAQTYQRYLYCKEDFNYVV
ncbi:VTC domain-containing protein [Enterococcus quebecensis]|uniref:Molecular chaperone n=1 Tax=Enterococcus quebecensis TaxID=903983 RepID=A0A1E5GTN0_9ENTE|nr:polyphosphate polymerase domain-containing protein [Enterococcus quebecensis]OEG16017.1 molecular chaperone [Enterococcus quebecensis]OJG74993.1 hypothetical protein RV12_GL002038 [Enterococcus quebecensis]